MRKRRDKVCHTCAWYRHIIGTHPQTGERIDEWECSIALLPMLLIENSREQTRTSDAVNDLKNEVRDIATQDQKIQTLRVAAMVEIAKRQQPPQVAQHDN